MAYVSDSSISGGGSRQPNLYNGSYNYRYVAYDNGSKLQDIKKNRTNHVNTQIKELTDKIKFVDEHLKKHDTTPFVLFEVNDFKLDTRDSDSFKHYAISLENHKTGVGQGNQFKLRIAYHKHFSNYSSINQLEYALGPLRKSSLVYDIGGLQSVKNQGRNKCTLQYGYVSDDQKLISPVYTGLLLKYSVTANKQIVEYTLEGFTGEQVAVNTVNWYPSIQNMDFIQLNDGTKVGKADLQLKLAQNKLSESQRKEIAKKLNEEFTDGIVFQPYLALDCFLQDYNASVDSNSTKYYLIDCTGKQSPQNLSNDNALEPVRMSICRAQTPIQYIEYLVGLFKYKTTTNYAIEFLKQQQQTSERFTYEFIRDKDDDKKIYVCIDYFSSSDEDIDSKVAYDFTGYSTDNNLLIDYNLNYDGTIALAIADNDTESKQSNAVYINDNGELRQKISLTRDMFVSGELDEVLISKQNTWLDKISTANNATMTTFGLPFEISVGTIFKCGIYITDTLHHSSGNCFVTSIVDRIENNQFTTNFELVRLPGKNNNIIEQLGG